MEVVNEVSRWDGIFDGIIFLLTWIILPIALLVVFNLIIFSFAKFIGAVRKKLVFSIFSLLILIAIGNYYLGTSPSAQEIFVSYLPSINVPGFISSMWQDIIFFLLVGAGFTISLALKHEDLEFEERMRILWAKITENQAEQRYLTDRTSQLAVRGVFDETEIYIEGVETVIAEHDAPSDAVGEKLFRKDEEVVLLKIRTIRTFEISGLLDDQHVSYKPRFAFEPDPMPDNRVAGKLDYFADVTEAVGSEALASEIPAQNILKGGIIKEGKRTQIGKGTRAIYKYSTSLWLPLKASYGLTAQRYWQRSRVNVHNLCPNNTFVVHIHNNSIFSKPLNKDDVVVAWIEEELPEGQRLALEFDINEV